MKVIVSAGSAIENTVATCYHLKQVLTQEEVLKELSLLRETLQVREVVIRLSYSNGSLES